MDLEGNIYLKKVTPVDVYIKGTGNNLTKESCLSVDLLKQQGQLELNKPAKVRKSIEYKLGRLHS